MKLSKSVKTPVNVSSQKNDAIKLKPVCYLNILKKSVIVIKIKT